MSEEISNKQIFDAIVGMKSDVVGIKDDLSIVKADLAVLKSDVAVLKSDVAVLKSDVAVLKSDVAVLKSDVAVLKSDVVSLKGSVKNLEEAVEVLNEKTDGLAGHIDTSIAESEHRMKDFVERRTTAAVEEIVSPMRKIDTKDTTLVEELAEKSIISPKESARITALSPFPAI